MKQIAMIFLMILLPALLTGQTYTGRSTRAGAAVPQVADDKTKPERYAPFLKMDVSFSDSSGNHIIDANETSELLLRVYNTGQTTAKDCKLAFAPKTRMPEISTYFESAIGDLKFGDTAIVKVLLRGNMNTRTQLCQFSIGVAEKNSFDLDPEKTFSVYSREFQPPILILAGYGISDENRDNKIQKAEKFTLTLRLQNIGENPASGIIAALAPAPNVIPLDDSLTVTVGEIKPGNFADVNATFVTNNKATNAAFTIRVSESYKKYGIDTLLTLPFNAVQNPTDQITITGNNARNKPVIGAGSLLLDIAEGIPSAGETKPDAVAVIIGNRDYTNNVPKVDYAINDAVLMQRYVTAAMGYSESNLLYYQNATMANLTSVFGNEGNHRGKLYDYVKRGSSEVFVYYSGHGAPDPDNKKAYLVPVDCDPENVKLNGYALSTLYRNLSQLVKEKDVKHVTVVFDACFSGASSAGSLLRGMSPVYITVDIEGLETDRATLFASSSADQVSNWYPDKRQGLFTYFFLKGLKGDADKNGDGNITASELSKYVSDEDSGVPYFSRRISGRTQTPTMSGTDWVLYEK